MVQTGAKTVKTEKIIEATWYVNAKKGDMFELSRCPRPVDVLPSTYMRDAVSAMGGTFTSRGIQGAIEMQEIVVSSAAYDSLTYDEEELQNAKRDVDAYALRWTAQMRADRKRAREEDTVADRKCAHEEDTVADRKCAREEDTVADRKRAREEDTVAARGKAECEEDTVADRKCAREEDTVADRGKAECEEDTLG
jgi:hypothetical protein